MSALDDLDRAWIAKINRILDEAEANAKGLNFSDRYILHLVLQQVREQIEK